MGEIFVSNIDREQIEEFFELASTDPDYFREGRNLTAAEKALIKEKDIWIVSYVNKVPKRWKQWLGDCFVVPNLGDYNGLQSSEWLKKSIELFEEREHRKPNHLEIVAEAQTHELFQRYKLCYVLSKPWNSRLSLKNYNQRPFRENVDLFLAFATKTDPVDRPYPYFEIICKNSLLENHVI